MLTAITLARALERLEVLQRQGQWQQAYFSCTTLLKTFTLGKGSSLAGSSSGEGFVQAAVGEVAYFLALALLQAGQETYSDQLLTQLGCTWRLSSALLQHAEAPVAPQPADIACEHSAGACTAGHNSPCQPVHIFCNILPASLCAALRTSFTPGSPFWAAHGDQSPGVPFFSYLCPLSQAQQPASRVAAAVRAVHAALSASPAGSMIAAATCVEWWAHARQPHEPHQLHFDADECLMRQGKSAYRLRHPEASCILYLSTASSAGATLIIDQTVASGLGDRGWLIHPHENQLAVFPGNLLHGVLPGRQLTTGDKAADGHRRRTEASTEHRITLMMAWWKEAPRPCHQHPTGSSPYFGPGMPFPYVGQHTAQTGLHSPSRATKRQRGAAACAVTAAPAASDRANAEAGTVGGQELGVPWLQDLGMVPALQSLHNPGLTAMWPQSMAPVWSALSLWPSACDSAWAPSTSTSQDGQHGVTQGVTSSKVCQTETMCIDLQVAHATDLCHVSSDAAHGQAHGSSVAAHLSLPPLGFFIRDADDFAYTYQSSSPCR